MKLENNYCTLCWLLKERFIYFQHKEQQNLKQFCCKNLLHFNKLHISAINLTWLFYYKFYSLKSLFSSQVKLCDVLDTVKKMTHKEKKKLKKEVSISYHFVNRKVCYFSSMFFSNLPNKLFMYNTFLKYESFFVPLTIPISYNDWFRASEHMYKITFNQFIEPRIMFLKRISLVLPLRRQMFLFYFNSG